jgi:hypothetical protein
MLPTWKNHTVSRPSAPDPKRTFVSRFATDLRHVPQLCLTDSMLPDCQMALWLISSKMSARQLHSVGGARVAASGCSNTPRMTTCVLPAATDALLNHFSPHDATDSTSFEILAGSHWYIVRRLHHRIRCGDRARQPIRMDAILRIRAGIVAFEISGCRTGPG